MAGQEDMMGQEDWREKCLVLESLLMKFRVQIVKIRELTADKIQLLETQVADAEKRAFATQEQLQWMEEKFKTPDGQLGDSEINLFKRCQELQVLVQKKEDMMVQLEQQLEEQKQSRLQDAKFVEEKAAKIKEWVMLRLSEFEVENAALREANQQQKAQVLELQKQVQAFEQTMSGGQGALGKPGEGQRLSSLTFGCFQVRGINPQVLTGPAPSQKTLSAQEDTETPCNTTEKQTGPLETNGDINRPDPSGPACSPRENRSEGLCGPESSLPFSTASEADSVCEGKGGACRFSRLSSETFLTASDDSSSLFDDDMQQAERPGFSLLDSSDGAPAECLSEDEEDPKAGLDTCTSDELNKRFQTQRLDSSSSTSEPTSSSFVLPLTLTPKRPNTPQDPRDDPASPKQPRLRVPVGFGLLSMSKKHLSQPSVSSEAAHGQTRNALSMLRPLQTQETEFDQQLKEGVELNSDTLTQNPSSSHTPLTISAETSSEPETEMSSERSDPEASAAGIKPPTPPLRRLPSWESRIYAVAKSGIRLSDTSGSDPANKSNDTTRKLV